MKLVLFDIDGTLLWTDGAGRSAIRTALLAEMGSTGPIEGFRFDGKTDPQIKRIKVSLPTTIDTIRVHLHLSAVPTYFPVNFGSRFSLKALTASWLSSVQLD
ncbi:MAG: hypothetical protein IH798_01970, partial [Gemmatimonadetes bacterium]|nr:hypothetical protein [Gemmatimonadota bacterium]